jgi:hypothetical protein
VSTILDNRDTIAENAMKIPLAVLVVSLLTTASFAQQRDDANPGGAIYGVAIDWDGRPAKGIKLVAALQTAAQVEPVSAHLHATTNESGEYHFENLGVGTYMIFPDDEEAGYDLFMTAKEDSIYFVIVRLTAEQPKVELRVHLPPQDAFLEVHLTNQKNGAPIEAIEFELHRTDERRSTAYKISSVENLVFLIPPDRDLLLHVSSPGFREWQESVGSGRPIRLTPGARLRLDVQLVPPGKMSPAGAAVLRG